MQQKKVQIDEKLFVKLFSYFMTKELDYVLTPEEQEIYDALSEKAYKIIDRQKYRQNFITERQHRDDVVFSPQERRN